MNDVAQTVPATNDVKIEGPKPELATKNDTLKCIVVCYKNMTYFGTDNPIKDPKAPPKVWRATMKPERLFAKIDAINADEKNTPELKTKKIQEAFKSLTFPQNNVAFTWTLDSGNTAQIPTQTKPLEGADTPKA